MWAPKQKTKIFGSLHFILWNSTTVYTKLLGKTPLNRIHQQMDKILHNLTKFVSIISLMCAAYHAHLILLALATLVIASNEYKLWNSSLCNFLHPRSKYLIQHPILKHPQSMWHTWNVWLYSGDVDHGHGWHPPHQ